MGTYWVLGTVLGLCLNFSSVSSLNPVTRVLHFFVCVDFTDEETKAHKSDGLGWLMGGREGM